MGQRLQVSKKLMYAVVGEAVEHVWSVLPRLDHSREPERAEVGARVLHWSFGQGSEVGDGALGLSEQVEDLDAFGGRDAVPDSGELGVERVLERAIACHRHKASIVLMNTRMLGIRFACQEVGDLWILQLTLCAHYVHRRTSRKLHLDGQKTLLVRPLSAS